MAQANEPSPTDPSPGWNYYEPGEDTMAEVPPVGDDKELQRLFETLRDDAEGNARDAYDDAARLVEAHRIRNVHQMIRSGPDKVATHARTLALMVALFAGVVLPVPEIPESESVVAVFSQLAQSILSVEYLFAALLLGIAIVIQTYGNYRSMCEHHG
jgi:hypothetical protein